MGMRGIIEMIGLVWDWTVRLLVASLGLLGLAASGVVAFEGWFPLAVILTPISLYLIVAAFSPERAQAGAGWIKRQIAKPHDRYFVPYVVQPIEAVVDAASHGVGRLLVGAFWVVVVVLGVALAGFAGWLVFKGIAAVPVSVAVIVGALIIAGALMSRRRD
jgi:hypothetical protein